ncbi:MAG: hypothetical protein ABW023_15230 [Sphingomonas sp.]
MTNLIKKAVFGTVLGATMLTAVAPAADAQRYRHYRHYGHDNTGAAVVAGIAGLAIGAALAGDRRYDYDRRYYRERGYYPRDGYYYRHYYPRYERCAIRRVWDPYEGRRVLVRYC